MSYSRFYTKGDQRENKLGTNKSHHKHSCSYGMNNNNNNSHENANMHGKNIGNGVYDMGNSFSPSGGSLEKDTRKLDSYEGQDEKNCDKLQRCSNLPRAKYPSPGNNIRINGISSHAVQNTTPNKTGTFTAQIHPPTSKYEPYQQGTQPKNQQKCLICGISTEKCCSLCRQAFYCSSQHQEMHWYETHKYNCSRRCQNKDSYHNMAKIGNNFATNHSNNNHHNFAYNSHSTNSNHINYQQKIQKDIIFSQKISRFLQTLEKQYTKRKKIINSIAQMNSKSSNNSYEILVRQIQQLLKISERIVKSKQEYNEQFYQRITKKDINNYSSELLYNELDISEIGISLSYIADIVLTIKIHHLCGMVREARQLIISLGKLLDTSEHQKLFFNNERTQSGNQSFEQNLKINPMNSLRNEQTPNFQPSINQIPHHSEDPLAKTKQLLLNSIIQLSELYNVDKTSESVYRIFIKRLELEEGIWQQIYGYYNIGIWYMKKTYYNKSVKSFTHCVDLLMNHKKSGVPQVIVFKANCLYNIALGYWSFGEPNSAIENMLQCYRIRINSIGKNSMEASQCLFNLSKWFRELERWHECLAYVEECHRIRKLYHLQGLHEVEFVDVKNLIIEIHESIKRQKKNQARILPNIEKKISEQEEREIEVERKGEVKENQENNEQEKFEEENNQKQEKSPQISLNHSLNQDHEEQLCEFNLDNNV